VVGEYAAYPSAGALSTAGWIWRVADLRARRNRYRALAFARDGASTRSARPAALGRCCGHCVLYRGAGDL